MRVIYADSVFILNFIIDYLLLLAAGKVCSLPLHRWRMAAGAAIGGAYALAALLWPALGIAAAKLAAALIMVAAAYGGTPRLVRTLVVFLAVSAAFGGAVLALLTPAGLSPGEGHLPLSLRTVLLAFALCYAALSLVFRRRVRAAERTKLPLTVSLHGRSVQLKALRDTGNCMDGVLIAEAAALAPLFTSPLPADPAEACLSLSVLPDMAGRVRLLSCTTAAGSAVLAAFRPDTADADIKYVALTHTVLSPDGEFNAIF